MRHPFQPLRETTSFIADLFTVGKFVLSVVVAGYAAAFIASTIAASPSGMGFLNSTVRALPAFLRNAAGW